MKGSTNLRNPIFLKNRISCMKGSVLVRWATKIRCRPPTKCLKIFGEGTYKRINPNHPTLSQHFQGSGVAKCAMRIYFNL